MNNIIHHPEAIMQLITYGKGILLTDRSRPPKTAGDKD